MQVWHVRLRYDVNFFFCQVLNDYVRTKYGRCKNFIPISRTINEYRKRLSAKYPHGYEDMKGDIDALHATHAPTTPAASLMYQLIQVELRNSAD